MGEDVFATLGLIDCLFSCPLGLKEVFVKKLSDKTNKFDRAQRILNEVGGESPICTTAKTIIGFLKLQQIENKEKISFDCALRSESPQFAVFRRVQRTKSPGLKRIS
jgi:hypothetical protein